MSGYLYEEPGGWMGDIGRAYDQAGWFGRRRIEFRLWVFFGFLSLLLVIGIAIEKVLEVGGAVREVLG